MWVSPLPAPLLYEDEDRTKWVEIKKESFFVLQQRMHSTDSIRKQHDDKAERRVKLPAEQSNLYDRDMERISACDYRIMTAIPHLTQAPVAIAVAGSLSIVLDHWETIKRELFPVMRELRGRTVEEATEMYQFVRLKVSSYVKDQAGEGGSLTAPGAGEDGSSLTTGMGPPLRKRRAVDPTGSGFRIGQRGPPNRTISENMPKRKVGEGVPT
eukprot:CAMPEP_0119138118 /NCGR_PEP_ID=MMETSP1310-20130426/25066_1 /TAXON_ID=464262 /ORGANISM="Genus nov. species nov., Strain RCC2339" /LENGTH=211 /DNA_ID=CAMNT_0007129275 /DNA_START=98 /DNA_END=730 /DNA_ORIENTATION=-